MYMIQDDCICRNLNYLRLSKDINYYLNFAFVCFGMRINMLLTRMVNKVNCVPNESYLYALLGVLKRNYQSDSSFLVYYKQCVKCIACRLIC